VLYVVVSARILNTKRTKGVLSGIQGRTLVQTLLLIDFTYFCSFNRLIIWCCLTGIINDDKSSHLIDPPSRYKGNLQNGSNRATSPIPPFAFLGHTIDLNKIKPKPWSIGLILQPKLVSRMLK